MNSPLEVLKAEHGGKCNNCRRHLRPDDEDYFLCNECWQLMLQHEFVAPELDPLDDRIPLLECQTCGEAPNDPLHSIKEVSGKCPNCGGIVFVGEHDQGLHYWCFKEFRDSLTNDLMDMEGGDD